MQRHVSEIGIGVVVVRVPVAALEIDLHIAAARGFTAKLQDCPAKIGARFAIPEARMQDLDGRAIEGAQLIAPYPLMKPDGLQQALRRRLAFFTQRQPQPVAAPPLGVLVGMKLDHLAPPLSDPAR